jgi:hypothetical protein
VRTALARVEAWGDRGDPMRPVLDQRPDLASIFNELERHAKDG